MERGDTVILEKINWCVERGQNWVILGPNGSGKTTLLAALTGYEMPTGGMIELLGEIYGESHWPELRKKIGFVSSTLNKMMAPDEPAIETVISGKYAMIDLWQKPTATDHRQARAILRRIECTDLVERPWRHLSQGERQRVLIARALMAKPKLLILDEPCAGLDPLARENFLQFLNNIPNQPSAPALALVTHHVEEIMPAFTHVLLLREGKVSAAGEVGKTLNSKTFSRSFGAALRITRKNGRYSLQVQEPWKSIM
jgi:iron complex transport system ATP-binding protein